MNQASPGYQRVMNNLENVRKDLKSSHNEIPELNYIIAFAKQKRAGLDRKKNYFVAE